MGVVTIKCPHTGEQVSTGIETDQSSFDGFPDVLAYSRCPACGLDHSWWKRDAVLAETVRPPTAMSPPTHNKAAE